MSQDLKGLPSRISSPAAWLGRDLARAPEKWRYDLSEADIEELERAARHYLSLGRDVGEITRDAFPLPRFADHLQQTRTTLMQGVGVEVLRGLPIER